jgi:hypothetical protein
LRNRQEWFLPEGIELWDRRGFMVRVIGGELVPVYGCATVKQHETAQEIERMAARLELLHWPTHVFTGRA